MRTSWETLLLCFVLLSSVSISLSQLNPLRNPNEDPRPYDDEDKWGPKRSAQEIQELIRSLHKERGLEAAGTSDVYPVSTSGQNDLEAEVEHYRIEDYQNSWTFYSGHLWVLNNPLHHFSVLPPLHVGLHPIWYLVFSFPHILFKSCRAAEISPSHRSQPMRASVLWPPTPGFLTPELTLAMAI